MALVSTYSRCRDCIDNEYCGSSSNNSRNESRFKTIWITNQNDNQRHYLEEDKECVKQGIQKKRNHTYPVEVICQHRYSGLQNREWYRTKFQSALWLTRERSWCGIFTRMFCRMFFCEQLQQLHNSGSVKQENTTYHVFHSVNKAMKEV